jgi:putative SOS response-associated peptidase YedK
MCGRIAIFSEPERLARVLDAGLAAELDGLRGPRWNVAPTTEVLGVADRRSEDGGDAGGLSRVLDRYRWGLVPPWAKDPAAGARMFNARAETVATKPSFRRAFASQRLLVPVDGFYEWQVDDRGKKHPQYFTRRDGAPMVLAGLWEWHGPFDGAGSRGAGVHAGGLLSCTVITTSAGPDMDGVHDRMPVVLDPGAWGAWLDPDNRDRPELEAMLVGSVPGTLVHHEVDPRVGNTRNDDPSLVEPLAASTPADPGVA